MKTVKQILGESQTIDYTDRLSVLSSLGLLEESKVGLVRRSLEKNPMNMTMAESKALKEFVDNILSQMLLEKQDYLSKFDKRVPKGYPSDRDMPTVLILKRKAIRVYPDNQKIALYYSQALDRYISIPYGPKGEPLGMVMNEETEQLNELYGMRRSEEEEAKKKEKIMQTLAGMKTKEGQLDSERISSFIKELPKTDLHLLPNDMKLRNFLPSDSDQDIAYMAGVAARRSLNKLVRRVAGRKKLPDQMQEPAKPEDAVKSKGPVQGPGTSYGMFGEGSVSDRFRSNVQMIHEERLNEGKTWDAAIRGGAGALELGKKLGKKALDAYEKYRKNAETNRMKRERNRKRQERQTRRDQRRGTDAKGAGALGAGALGADKIKSLLQNLGLGTADYSNPNPLGEVNPTTPSKSGSSYLPGAAEKGRPPSGPTSWDRITATWLYGSGPGPVNTLSESNLSIIRKLSRSKSLLEQKINFLDENDLTINKGTAKKIMKVYNSLNESNKGKMEKMLNESVVTFTQAINFAVRQ